MVLKLATRGDVTHKTEDVKGLHVRWRSCTKKNLWFEQQWWEKLLHNYWRMSNKMNKIVSHSEFPIHSLPQTIKNMDSNQSSWYLEYGRVQKWEYTPVFGQLARTHDVQNHWILGVPNFGTTYQQRTSALSLEIRDSTSIHHPKKRMVIKSIKIA